MTRREMLALPLAAPAYASAQTGQRFTKGICSIIFPQEMPRAQCFVQAKSTGFDAVELAIGPDLSLNTTRDEARTLADAAQKTGIQIATLWVSEPLHENPLNSPDPAVRARGSAAASCCRRAPRSSADAARSWPILPHWIGG